MPPLLLLSCGIRFPLTKPWIDSEADAVAVMRKIFDAISYLHDQGIVHRDLKVRHPVRLAAYFVIT